MPYIVLVLTALLGLTAETLMAQGGPGPLVTDRPDQTESSATVDPGFVQIETGLSFTREDQAGVRTDVLAVPGTLLRIGIVPRVEGRLGFDGWQRVEQRAGGASQTADGVADLSLGLKVRLTEERRGLPQIALIASTTVPTGEDGFGSERTDPTFLLAASNTLSEAVSVGYNVGLGWTSVPAGDGTETLVDALYSLAFGFGLTDRVGAFVEAFGSLGLDAGAPDPISLDGGLTLLLRDNLQLDVSGGIGVNDAADDWFVAGGLAVRVPR